MDWLEYLKRTLVGRRANLSNELANHAGVFGQGNLTAPIKPFRNRIKGEGRKQYFSARQAYYNTILDVRWARYMTTLDKEARRAFRFGSLRALERRAQLGRLDIPPALVAQDIYEISFNVAVTDFAGFEVALGNRALAVATRLENAIYLQAQRAGEFLAKGVNNSVRQMVSKVVEASLSTPKFTRQDFINYLKPVINSDVRAMAIARTESTRAVAHATETLADTMRDNGFQPVEVWITERIARVCPICRPRDGKVRGTEWVDYPPAHVNCNCWVELQMRDSEGKLV